MALLFPVSRSSVCLGIAVLALLLAVAAAPGSAEDEAESPLVERARELCGLFGQSRSPGETEDYRQELVSLADELEEAGELSWATQVLERAGILSYMAAEHDRALRTWERGLRLARAAADSSRIGALLNAKAAGVSATGDHQRALSLFEELVEFRRAAGDRRGEGVSLTNLAFEQIGLFYVPEAMTALRQAIDAHREVSNDAGLSVAARLLTTLHATGGRPEEALRWAELSVRHAEVVGEASLLAPALMTRGQQLLDLGRLAEAGEDLERGLRLAEQNDMERLRPLLAAVQADLLVEQGRFAEASARLEPELGAIDREGQLGAGLTARVILARALWHEGRRGEALARLDSLHGGFFALQDTLRDPLQRAQSLSASSVLSVLPALLVREGREVEVWTRVEESLATELRRSLLDAGEIVPLSAWQDSLTSLDARALSFGLPGREGLPVTVVDEGLQAFVVEFTPQLRADLDRLQSLLASGAEDEKCVALVTRISEALAEPLRAVTSSPRPSRLVILPGGLGGVALELLRDEDGRSLTDVFAVTYAPSATTFLALEARRAAGRGFLAVGDPSGAMAGPEGRDPGAATSVPAARRAAALRAVALPQAREEVRRIAPRGATLLLGKSATVSAVLAEAPDKAVLHFATHASVDPWMPQNSALVLAEESRESLPTSGRLDARELEQARLACDLVTLSGCSTAGGYRILGEGSFGLHRAFLIGGARSVVASQWQVEDGAARRFMELFYDSLARGSARDRAVQQARATMAEEGYSYRDRAAFVLFGAVTGVPPVLREGTASLPTVWLLALLLPAGLVALALRHRRARSAD